MVLVQVLPVALVCWVCATQALLDFLDPVSPDDEAEDEGDILLTKVGPGCR